MDTLQTEQPQQPYQLAYINPNPSFDRSLEALIVGTRGENSDFLLELVTKAVNANKNARIAYKRGDPEHTTQEIKENKTFQDQQNVVREKLEFILNGLSNHSLPNFSMRHVGNMICDPTLPAMAGYIAGALFNPNNLSEELGPFTTYIEVELGKKLVEMFNLPPYQKIEPEYMKNPEHIESWCHMTGGGSTGNLEAFWAGRTVKFHPLAVRIAITTDPELKAAADKIFVRTAKGEKKLLVDCNAWEIINIDCDEALCLTKRVYDALFPQINEKTPLDFDRVCRKIQACSMQKVSLYKTFQHLMDLEEDKSKAQYLTNPVCFVSPLKHFCIAKSMSILGLGEENLRPLKVDKDVRMDLEDLTQQLEECARTHTPVVTVVAVLGTTCESAVDPLSDILDLRDRLRQEYGMNFNVHVDAAYGGYFATLLKPVPDRPDYDIRKDDKTSIARAFLSDHSAKHYARIKDADTVVLDPHKTGYCPFPAGVFVQRNHLMKSLLHFGGPFLAGSVVGFYGVGGSKAAASSCAAWLSHECLPLHKGGHGTLLGLVLYGVKRYYAKLLNLPHQISATGERKDLPLKVTCLPRLPEEKKENPDPEVVKQQYERVIKEIALVSDEELSQRIYQDDEFSVFFNQIGPDLGILCYHFNFRDPKTGQWNTSLQEANEFNDKIYQATKPLWDAKKGLKHLQELPIVTNKTVYEKSKVGEKFFNDLLQRIGCVDDEGEDSTVCLLRTVVMHPFLNETTGGSMFDIIIQELTKLAMKFTPERRSSTARVANRFRRAVHKLQNVLRSF